MYGHGNGGSMALRALCEFPKKTFAGVTVFNAALTNREMEPISGVTINSGDN